MIYSIRPEILAQFVAQGKENLIDDFEINSNLQLVDRWLNKNPEFTEAKVTANEKGEITSLHYYCDELEVPNIELNILGETGEIIWRYADASHTFKIS